ncbi:MAG: hypothetical protein ACXAC5_03410 [Promethearchaeota archaeon]
MHPDTIAAWSKRPEYEPFCTKGMKDIWTAHVIPDNILHRREAILSAKL